MANPLPNLPFMPGYKPPLPDTNLIGAVTGAIKAGEQAVQEATQIGSKVAGTTAVATDAAAAAASAAAGAVQAAEGAVIAATTPAAPASSVAVTPGGGAVAKDLTSIIGQAALDAAKSTSGALLPGLEKAVESRVASVVQAELSNLVTKVQGGTDAPVPDLQDFTKADARSHAFRTLLIGLGLSVLWGVVNVLGNATTVDWTNKDALPQVISLAVGSVVTSVGTYLSRLLKEPAHITNATIIPGPASSS